jgi:hypothetical protein
MLASLDFLLGQWKALSQPGEPSGEFRFSWQLQSKIILRNNHADYPATGERPAFRHEDLMVIYCDEAENLMADYYDSEGHVIHYSGQVNAIHQVVFTSSPATSGPRFRLSYYLKEDGKLRGTFDMTTPTQPNVFVPYLEWSAVKIAQIHP